MRELQAHGVAAGTVANNRRVVEDPQLNSRGFWPEVETTSVGRHQIASVAWHNSRTPGGIHWGAPNLGEHTDYVLKTILGKTDEQITALRESGVLETMPEELLAEQKAGS